MVGVLALASFVWVALVGRDLKVWVRVLALIMGVAFGYLFLRMARVAVREDPRGILVINWFVERRVPWSQIRRFGLDSRFDWGGWSRIAFVELNDGSRIRLSSTLPMKAIDALNEARGAQAGRPEG